MSRRTGLPLTMSIQEERISIRDAERDKAIAVIGADMSRIKSDVQTVMSNHIPHLNDAVDRLEKKVDTNHEKMLGRMSEIEVKLSRLLGGGAVLWAVIQLAIKYLPQLLNNS